MGFGKTYFGYRELIFIRYQYEQKAGIRKSATFVNEIIDTTSKGAQIRLRANSVNEGEKNKKYFLSLEKKNQSNNAITQLNTENGIV